jgi:2'-5' RNA ligase
VGIDMTDDEFVRAFEGCALPNSAFHHRDHVRLAWIYLRRHPALTALACFTEGLQRFAAFNGHPGLYHETITLAYLVLIHERMADAPGDETFEAFAARNPDLLAWKPSILDRYYDPETLGSERARRLFVMPGGIQ